MTRSGAGGPDSIVLGYWPDRPAAEALEIAEAAEAAGFAELWLGEMATFDAFALATAVGLRCPALGLTIGPLAVHVRSAAGIAMGVASVAELVGPRVDVALGTSSPAVVAWHGRHRQEPAATLAISAAEVHRLLAGERGVTGFRLRLPPPRSTVSIAAFGPRGIEVAARLGDRLVLNMVPLETVVRHREALEAAAARADRPRPPIALWLAAAVDPTRDTEAQLAAGLVQYLQAPGYGELFIDAGFADLVSRARSGESTKRLVADLPPEVCRTLGLVGTVDEIAERMAAYRAAGVDEICIVPATAGDPGGRRTMEALSDLR
jgi:probable F420-dependent oxidoreductase